MCNAHFFITDRSQTKENNTMRTVIRGLFAFFTYVNVIEPSSDRSPTAESKELWGSVK
ncbi:hypothetical protein PAEPH01_2937 [Pancytospora epiphaga]|nr:hypothetical protein PAEPH01_2937 [Pancytospora epiphaga]